MIDILHEEFEIPSNPVEISDLVEEQLELKMDKRSVVYLKWRKKMNEIVEKYNELIGFKAYSKFY